MKKSHIGVLLFALIFSAGIVSAQEEMEMEMEIDMESEVTMEDSEVVAEGEITTEEEMTPAEEEIVEEAEDIDESEVDSSEDLTGEIILITENEIVLQKVDGSTVKVATETYTKNRPGAHRRAFAVGQKITTATVTNVDGGLAINTATGMQTVAASVPVTKSGKVVAQSEVESNDELVAMYDVEGNLIGLEIVSSEDDMAADYDEEKEKEGKVGIIIAIVLAIILGVLFARRKKA